MKAIFVYLGFILFLFSCSDNNGKTEATPKLAHAEHILEAASPEVELNHGKKWKSDTVTNTNITLISQKAEQARHIEAKEISAYNQAGEGIQKQLDKLVSECRMKGADHEALHKWLTPLFSNVSLLKKASNVQEASRLIEEIYNHLNSYSNYFE